LVEREEFLASFYPSKLLLGLEKNLEAFDSKLGMAVVFFCGVITGTLQVIS
jgi:hypothetical protein